MDYRAQFQTMLASSGPLLALAPMQDVTTYEFWKLIARYGGADFYVTEYFRVHASSSVRKNHLLRLITENPTGRPVIAQLIGNDIPSLVRTARELQSYPIAGIDLNLGCPAPVVYRKCAGAGLLREPQRIEAILGALREVIHVPFSIKTRIGFASPEEFSTLLPIFARHRPDLLTVHGRVVSQQNSGPVNYELIRQAVEAMPCPVIANGGIDSAHKALQVLSGTRTRGLMLGRGAIRNPWLFEQIRQLAGRGAAPLPVRGRDLLGYIEALYESIGVTCHTKPLQLRVLKKYLTFFDDLEPTGAFLHAAKRADSEEEFFAICRQYFDHPEPVFNEAQPVTVSDR